MSTAGKILTFIGAVLLMIELIAISTFAFGAVAFWALYQGEYFAGYVVLNGYYPGINLLFLLDYFAIMFGSWGSVFVIPGMLLWMIGSSIKKRRNA